MKPPLFIAFLLFTAVMFPFPATAQGSRVEEQIDTAIKELQLSAENPQQQLNAAWQLGLFGPAARNAVPVLGKMLLDPKAHPQVRMSALNAVGHIGISDSSAVKQIVQSLKDNPNVFKGAGAEQIVNGSFESISVPGGQVRETGVFGETMFLPGSLDLTGWVTYAGIIMIQDECARPGGSNSVELGPRDVPGCISQTISTAVGETYQLNFYTCAGRNRQLRVRVADVERTVECPLNPGGEMITVPFKASSALTTVTFCGLGDAGFGPMIDGVRVEPGGSATPAFAGSQSSRVQQLDAIAQRLRGGSDEPSDLATPPRATSDPNKLPTGAIDLMSEQGLPFVGHQLEFFDMSEPGILGSSKPGWINLYRTEGRDFALTGEVELGGPSTEMLFPNDLPDGFALFLREWDGLQRYQLDSRSVTVKRRLLHGRPVPDIISLAQFAPPGREGWIPFQVRVSESMIEYSFGGHVTRIPGPLHTDGANKIAIAPKTRLRNLQLQMGDRAPRFGGESVEVISPALSPGFDRSPQALASAPARSSDSKAVRDGEYLLNLEWWNQKQTVSLAVTDGHAKVIKTNEPRLEGATGSFEMMDDGAFYIFLKTDTEGLGGQIWWLQPDGSFEIKEIPDRGEKQRAIRVPR